METLERLNAIYAEYRAEFLRRDQARKPGDGLFGLGAGPGNDPCHDRFAGALEDFLRETAAQHPGSAQVRRVLEFIYRAPLEHPGGEDAVYWMLLAVHSLTLELIAQLDPPDARALWEDCRAAYPRRVRMAGQKRVLSALKARAGG